MKSLQIAEQPQSIKIGIIYRHNIPPATNEETGEADFAAQILVGGDKIMRFSSSQLLETEAEKANRLCHSMVLASRLAHVLVLLLNGENTYKDLP